MNGFNRQIPPLLYLALCLSQASLVHATEMADRVFMNAKVYTANPVLPFAEAVAVKDQTIIFVGSNNDAKKLRGDKTDIINLKGQQLLPGFIDNHNHIFEAASEAGGSCELSPEATPSEQLPHLRYCLESRPGDKGI